MRQLAPLIHSTDDTSTTIFWSTQRNAAMSSALGLCRDDLHSHPRERQLGDFVENCDVLVQSSCAANRVEHRAHLEADSRSAEREGLRVYCPSRSEALSDLPKISTSARRCRRRNRLTPRALRTASGPAICANHSSSTGDPTRSKVTATVTATRSVSPRCTRLLSLTRRSPSCTRSQHVVADAEICHDAAPSPSA